MSLEKLRQDIDKVDVLINNAGVGHDIGVTKQLRGYSELIISVIFS